jgi:uncharacterized alkaline shock family protein YloU
MWRVEIARRVAAAAQEVPDVLGLHGGVLGEIATYGQGGPVRGVCVRRPPEAAVELHLVVRFGARLDEVADAVRERVSAALVQHSPAFVGARVDVHVADVDVGGSADAADSGGGGGGRRSGLLTPGSTGPRP